MDWTILTSVLGGAVGASVITAFVNWRMKLREEKHEQRRWVREKRYELYIELFDFAKSLHDEEDERNHNDRGREMHDYFLKTQLIGSIPVSTAFFNLDLEHYNSGFRSDQTEFELARKALYEALREDLGTYDTPKAGKVKQLWNRFFKRNLKSKRK